MKRLLQHNLLPRLVDAACSQYPQAAVMLSWRMFLSPSRAAAEQELGHHPDLLQRFWVSKPTTGTTIPTQYQPVHRGTDEYGAVQTIFLAPKYGGDGSWASRARIQQIQRVEGTGRHEVFRSAVKEIKGLVGEDAYHAGAHTRWLFHGSDTKVIDDIALSSHNPNKSGSPTSANLWGRGMYFARDAEYSVNYCSKEGPKKMLLCLIACGPACQGKPKEDSPPKWGPNTPYACSVDCLSNPEIFVVILPQRIFNAYVITFEC